MIIIDGYNLLFAQKEDISNLKSARTLLLELLERYNVKKGVIKVIFDVKTDTFVHNSKTKTEKGKIEVIFSPKGTSADDYIIELVRNSDNKGVIKVVTSDKRIADHVKKLGAQTVPSDEFMKEVREFFKTDRVDDYYYEKEHGISKSEVDYWMKVFGFDKK